MLRHLHVQEHLELVVQVGDVLSQRVGEQAHRRCRKNHRRPGDDPHPGLLIAENGLYPLPDSHLPKGQGHGAQLVTAPAAVEQCLGVVCPL